MKTNTDLLKGNILKSLLLFMLPLIFSRIFQQLYNTVDTMIVGNYLGDNALAAMGASSAVYELLNGFAMGVGGGLSIVTARCFGTGDVKLLKRSVAGALVIGLSVSVVIMIASRFVLRPLLVLLKTPEEIIDQSYEYVSILTLYIVVMFAYNLLAGLLRAIGNSVMPLVFLIFSAILNIFLDIYLITVVKMGVSGAATATVIAQGISAILCLVYVCIKCRILLPAREHFKFDASLYKDMFSQGVSMGFMMAIVSTGTVILQSAINDFGTLTIAGHTAARKVNSLCMMPMAVMGMTMSTFISQNRGANQGERIRKGVVCGNLLCLGFGVVIMLVMYPFAPAIVKAISGSSEQTVLDIATWYLWITAPFYIVLGILSSLRNGLQGLGQKVVPLFSSIIELVSKILFAVFIIPKMGYWGVIICEPVIWCLMCGQLLFSFYRNEYIRQFKGYQWKKIVKKH